MASPWQFVIDALADRLDTDLLPAIYAAASVPTPQIRSMFREAGVPFLDPETGLQPSVSELEEAAARIIREARNASTAVGAVSGVVGAVAVPPEVLASLVQILRMGQRLAVLFGFDPETDAGKLVLWRAIAGAFDISLPEKGELGLRISQLPDLIRSQLPATQQASDWVVRQVATRAALTAAQRVIRVIPGLSMGFSAWTARRRMGKMGERMVEVYRRAMEAQPWELADEALAVEVPG